MKSLLKKHLTFLAGAVIALTLATLLVKIRYELEMLRQRSDAEVELHATAAEVAALLERMAQREEADDAPQAARTWHRWQPHGRGFKDSVTPIPVSMSALLDANGSVAPTNRWRLRGPFATEQGRNVLAIVSPVAAAGAATAPGTGAPGSGDWVFADELLPAGRLEEWLRTGFRLQLFDESGHIALYQSDEGAVNAPVSVTVPFGDAHLTLRAAPRAGWHVPPRYLSSCLLVLVAVALWLTYELRRGQILRNALEEAQQAEMRRRDINQLYGNALQSVAALESRLQVVSMYDAVTGLANRTSLVHRIESSLESMRQGSRATLGVMAIGFDHFHHITNSFGAEFASRVLVVAAERVEFVLRSKEQLFRTGDFHLAVVPPPAEPGFCEKLAQQIVEEIQAPISLDSHTFMLHPSVGIAETQSGYEYAEILLDRANAALGAVRHDAPVRYCLFDSAAAKDSVSRLQLEVDLNRGFDENQFVLEYEPLVMPVTHDVAGFEALIRWNHPTEGRIAPGRFIPIAVEAGMSHRLNNWVMREAVRQAAVWYHMGYRELFVNFNLSAEAFLRPQLAEEVAAVLAEFDLPGRNIVIELTESTLIQDIRAAARTLGRLGELGVGAWLDDFGTGYSSLSYLRALPLKGVKIDRSFVERTVIDARDFGFLKALIDLISYLGMQSIAEGIETREQYELLSLTTCDLYQGWHFAHSMPAAKAERWMQEAGHVIRQGKSA